MDSRTVVRVRDRLIDLTTKRDGYYYVIGEREDWLVPDLRKAVLALHWQGQRIKRLEAQVAKLKERVK